MRGLWYKVGDIPYTWVWTSLFSIYVHVYDRHVVHHTYVSVCIYMHWGICRFRGVWFPSSSPVFPHASCDYVVNWWKDILGSYTKYTNLQCVKKLLIIITNAINICISRYTSELTFQFRTYWQQDFPQVSLYMTCLYYISITCMCGLGLWLQMTSVHDYAILWVCTTTCIWVHYVKGRVGVHEKQYNLGP